MVVSADDEIAESHSDDSSANRRNSEHLRRVLSTHCAVSSYHHTLARCNDEACFSNELPTANRKFARRGFLYKPSKFALAARNLAAVITKQHIEDEVSSKLPANERESFMTRRR